MPKYDVAWPSTTTAIKPSYLGSPQPDPLVIRKKLHRSYEKVSSCGDVVIKRSLAAADGLNEEQREFQQVATAFAQNEMKPHMKKWDEKVEQSHT